MNKIVAHTIAFSTLLCFVSPVLAQAPKIPNYGPDNFVALLTGIAGAVAGLVGTVGTIMIIVAGIFYLTSAGNPQRMEVAKKTLIYAVVGIAIALSVDAIIAIVKTAISAKT